MKISPIANDLIEAIRNYEDESIKTNYRFTIEEQMILEKELQILKNHLHNIEQYEIKKELKEKENH